MFFPYLLRQSIDVILLFFLYILKINFVSACQNKLIVHLYIKRTYPKFLILRKDFQRLFNIEFISKKNKSLSLCPYCSQIPNINCIYNNNSSTLVNINTKIICIYFFRINTTCYCKSTTLWFKYFNNGMINKYI